jgi:hypothetical protein
MRGMKENTTSVMVTCPNCHESFPLTEALDHQARELLIADERDRLRGKAREEVAPQLEELRELLNDRDAQIADQRKKEVELRRRQRDLDQRQEGQELALERMRDDIGKEARQEAEKAAARTWEAKLRDREEALKRTNDQLAELERQTKRDPRQQEGVAAQQVFGDALRERFPEDEIVVVRQGQAGGDVIQVVRTTTGYECGRILWECKRTSKWEPKWLLKLATDREASRADLVAIVSEVLPKGVRGSGPVGNAWVTDFESVWQVAPLLRAILLQVAAYRAADAARDDSAEKVFDYIATGDFANRLQSAAKGLDALQSGLDREKRSLQQAWAERQRNIDHAYENLSFLVGDLIGLGAPVPAAARAELLPPQGGIAALPGVR